MEESSGSWSRLGPLNLIDKNLHEFGSVCVHCEIIMALVGDFNGFLNSTDLRLDKCCLACWANCVILGYNKLDRHHIKGIKARLNERGSSVAIVAIIKLYKSLLNAKLNGMGSLFDGNLLDVVWNT